jgi:hypothetical protein
MDRSAPRESRAPRQNAGSFLAQSDGMRTPLSPWVQTAFGLCLSFGLCACGSGSPPRPAENASDAGPSSASPSPPDAGGSGATTDGNNGADAGVEIGSDAGLADCVGPFSLEHEQPVACVPYANATHPLLTQKLPSDVMSHCWGNSGDCSAGDAIAKCALTDCGDLSELSNPLSMGLLVWSSPGRDDFGEPLYYSAPTDPWYSLAAATPNGQQTFTFRAPSGALVSEGAEAEIAIWDQSTGQLFGAYACCGPQTGKGIPIASGCGDTQATACPLTGFTYKSVAGSFTTTQDWGNSPEPQTSNGTSPFAGTLREQELQQGVINHAIMLTVDCVNAAEPHVFPAPTNPGVCGTPGFSAQDPTRPSAGTLIFCDYTPSQIASFQLPPWQSSILTAMCTYGAYISETQGANTGLNLVGDENRESSEAWKYYGLSIETDPFWPWITSQKGLDGTLDLNHVGCEGGSPGSDASQYRCVGAFLANIPRTTGPGGMDVEGNACASAQGCYPSGHVHVADVCVPKGLANEPGGCL